MLFWALSFFLISILAGVLGFGGLSAEAADITRVLFYFFLILFLISSLLSLFVGRRRRGGMRRG